MLRTVLTFLLFHAKRCKNVAHFLVADVDDSALILKRVENHVSRIGLGVPLYDLDDPVSHHPHQQMDSQKGSAPSSGM